jgi:nicotinate-nucleotide pyrophosphorylase (carboxylating)
MLFSQLVRDMVAAALLEDIGSGDISAELIAPDKSCRAQVITREPAVICGVAWVNETFLQIESQLNLIWQVKDGDIVAANTLLFEVEGCARAILSAERTALNFLQLLSATATATLPYVKALKGTTTKLLDTRKTLPLYRVAQKYAVTCAGGYNHRMGLFDAFLIKENHIAACGSITAAIAYARALHPEKVVEVEVETLVEYQEALAAQPDIIMLDNFSFEAIKIAVAKKTEGIALEISGNMNLETVTRYATLGVEYISVGALTKHIKAIDLSLRVLV